MIQMLERTNRMNFLFDFYQSLLTEKQRIYLQMYYLEDFSLGEISEIHEVSRQAVYDNIKRTEKTLENYEEKLHLYEKFTERKSIINHLETAFSEGNENQVKIFINQLKESE